MLDMKYMLETCAGALELRSYKKAYAETFELLRCDTPELQDRAFRLRHQIYCVENGYECPSKAGNYMEQDAYDAQAVHFVLRRRISNETAGTVRIILPNDDDPQNSFPIQKYCDAPFLKDDLQALTMFEISRFCMARRFRKRADDGQFLSSYHMQDFKAGFSKGNISFIRRRIAYAPAGLLSAAFETALNARIMDGMWMVEPRHLWSLDKIGFPYQRLADRLPVHGGLIPIIFNIKHVLDHMHRHAPTCWEIVSDSGRLQDMADTLDQNDWQDRLLID